MTSTIPTPAAKTAKVLLVVDDEFLIRWSLRSHLTAAGYIVIEADTLKAARALMNRNIDVVLLDLMLPDGSGMELLDEIHAKFQTLPVIMLSAHATRETVETAAAKGAYRFLHKPFELETIARTVQQATVDTP